MMLVLPFILGVVAGLRSMTPPAGVSWAAHFGWVHLEGTPFAFLEAPAARYILLGLMLGELVADKLPFTPGRIQPGAFVARIATGAFSGVALAAGVGGSLTAGAAAGALGAIVGTLGGYRARTGLVRRFAVPDYIVALAEDVLAVAGAALAVAAAGLG